MANLTSSTTNDTENPDLYYLHYNEVDMLDIIDEMIFPNSSGDITFLEGYSYSGLLATLLFQVVALPFVVIFVIAIYSTRSADFKVFINLMANCYR